MKNQILQNINDPEALERLFRSDNRRFTIDFPEAAAGIETDLVHFWEIRLSSSENTPRPGMKQGLMALAGISIVVMLLAKLPLLITDVSPERFYSRNLGVLIFAGLTAWFALRNRITGWNRILILALPMLLLTLYLNLLPETLTDTSILALLHAPLFMGFVFALVFVAFDLRNTPRVTGFIRYCGELIIMTGLLAIAGAIFSGMTISLFAIIGMNIEKGYVENVAIPGVTVFPVIAAWLISLYPGITDRIAPVIARIFTPVVLLTAGVYLVAIALSGISLSENRDFLLMFNILLLGVMAIIVFSLSELDKSDIRKLNVILLFLLAVVTLLIDLFALSGIITRLSDGFTPNRTVVLISNLLILINLLLILPDLFLAGFRGKTLGRLENIIRWYLPVYFVYSVVVIFLFPFVFGMK